MSKRYGAARSALPIVLCSFLLTPLLAGCNPGAALFLQDWGRDLLTVPAAVVVGELIDQAQGENNATDPNALLAQLQADLDAQLNAALADLDTNTTTVVSGTTTGERGPAGADGADGVDGKDGVDGQDGKDGVDGAAGQDGADGQDGVDGADGQDGKDYLAIAVGCVSAAGAELSGYGSAAEKAGDVAGVYTVRFDGYAFPEGFATEDLIILVSTDAIVHKDVMATYDPETGAYGFTVEFRDIWLNRVNADFCFAAYDVSVDPYAN